MDPLANADQELPSYTAIPLADKVMSDRVVNVPARGGKDIQVEVRDVTGTGRGTETIFGRMKPIGLATYHQQTCK